MHDVSAFADYRPWQRFAVAGTRILTKSRIFSVYKVTDGLTIWIITEADRSSTCLMLPEEY